MQGILLDRVASVTRRVSQPTGYNDTVVYQSIRCAIVPISKLDQATPYAYESTHLIWVDYWLELRKEDQVKWARRPLNPQGDIVPWIYTINGRREFHLGIPQIAYYARELD